VSPESAEEKYKRREEPANDDDPFVALQQLCFSRDVLPWMKRHLIRNGEVTFVDKFPPDASHTNPKLYYHP
jgi:hypothetical protein